MTTLTPLEVELLQAIKTDDYHDGAAPVGNPVWSSNLNVSMPERSVPGVMSSLVKKELVRCDGQGRDATVTLLQAGADALAEAQAVPAAPRPAFQTWEENGVKFLATDNGRQVHVVDEKGNNYGSWLTLENYREASDRGMSEPVGGKVVVRVDVTPELVPA